MAKLHLPSVSVQNKKIAPSDGILILHGMFSHAGNMRALKKALDRRECYQHVGCFNLSLDHKIIPQVGARERAWELVPKIETWIRKNKIRTFDICGHSNGGYVALELGAIFEEKVPKVFTLGTPKGLPIDYGDSATKIFHLHGGMDEIPIWVRGQCNPGDGEWVIQFPDDTHSSVHVDSENNGVADVIMWMNGKNLSLFADRDNVLHIWPHCIDCVSSEDRRHNIHAGRVLICNGIHDADLEEKKAAARKGIVTSTPWLRLISKPILYYKIVADLKEKTRSMTQEVKLLRASGSECEKDIKALEKENRIIEKRIKEFEKKAAKEISAFRKRTDKKIAAMKSPLEIALEIASAENISDFDLAVITELIEEAAIEHSELVASISTSRRISHAKNRFGAY